MATLVSVITLVLTGQYLTPVSVFMLLAFINILRLALCTDLANGLLLAYDAYVSLGRVEDFLLLENLPLISTDQISKKESDTDTSVSDLDRTSLTVHHREKQGPNNTEDLQKPASLHVRNLTHKQIKRDEKFILQDITFTAAPESMTVITGPVGSGKSTLLSAIAGEIPDIAGTISWKGTLVYVPQIAWVFSGTIRENILFGEPYDEAKYTRVIEACSLKEDIQQFPDSDQIVVGERGEVLSGGQRARVNLARAVYADADIYLLDDPLSAVDFKVGKHIFEKCIKGLLGLKTRLITSHQEQLFNEADKLIVLYKGSVLGSGGFTELKEDGILNTTVDPLYKELNQNEPDADFGGDNEEKEDVSGGVGRIILQTNEVKCIQISEEDRTIGVVSSKLYWNYFRSGISVLLISAVICVCLMTQGKDCKVL